MATLSWLIICRASDSSESTFTETKTILSGGRVEERREYSIFATREAGSEADQKLTSTYLPRRLSREISEPGAFSSRAGASLPISMSRLTPDMDDDRKRAAAGRRGSASADRQFLKFTITTISYTITATAVRKRRACLIMAAIINTETDLKPGSYT